MEPQGPGARLQAQRAANAMYTYVHIHTHGRMYAGTCNMIISRNSDSTCRRRPRTRTRRNKSLSRI